MSAVKWTTDQESVIGLRNRDMLVSAAAGSGKTAVLIERIFSRITDPDDPVNVDDMLVVTFTESAAAQMKQRIRTRLEEEVRSGAPATAERARDQLIRLPQAQISTIHGFCSTVIRDWFNVIDLEPDFRVLADEGERKMMETEALTAMLEEEYAAAEPGFIEAAHVYGGSRDDAVMMELIRSLREVAMSFPDPAGWLSDSIRYYEIPGPEDFENSDLCAMVRDSAARCAAQLAGRAGKLLDSCLLPGGPYMYEEAVKDDLRLLTNIQSAQTLAQMKEICAACSWAKLKPARDSSVDPSLKDKCQKERSAIKKQFESEIAGTVLTMTYERMAGLLETALRQGRELVRLTLGFDAAYTELKRRRKVIDFSDMEHLALEILQTRDADGRDYIAGEYRSHFAEVMIDEYQDSNYLQEEILRIVSGGEGRHNRFMVGDVKQSIYRFRNARPEMFVAKQRRFPLYDPQHPDESRALILLHKNFRSTPGVLDLVNRIFFRLMSADIGGIDYDRGAALYPGREDDGKQTGGNEVWVIPAEKMSAADEARLVAGRIRKMLAEERIPDNETGEMRPVRFGDIVILSRSLSNWAEEFYEEMTAENIPVFMPKKSGYFERQEIGTILDFLRIVGNEKQDIPLAAVMTSCIGNFTDDELAFIRAEGRDCEFFHEAVRAYAESGQDGRLRGKLRAFLAMVRDYRDRAPCTPVHLLLTQMIGETGYRSYICALPGGEQRRANLDALVDKACSYAETGYRGISRFLEYIGQLDQNNVDYGEAGILDENADVVRMSTIHKSKGLEYPIVFLVGMGRQFNRRDSGGKVLVHPELGLGLMSWDLRTRVKSTTPVREIVKKQLDYDDMGEEMRVLYVACTRAREKLIMTGCVKGITDYQDLEAQYGIAGDRSGGILPVYRRVKAACFYDWILPVMIDEARQPCPSASLMIAGESDLMSGAGEQDTAGDIWESAAGEAPPDEREIIDREMAWSYPHALAMGVPQKVTVSELKRLDEEAFVRALDEEPDVGVEFRFAEEAVNPAGTPDAGGGSPVRIREIKPKFAQGEGKRLTPAERGTVHHKLLLMLDFTDIRTDEKLALEVDSLRDREVFTPEEADALRVDRVAAFLRSDLARRMGKAQEEGTLRREQPFVIGVDASEVDPSYPAGETVLVQGIIDAYFEEDGRLVIVDYKTDRVKSSYELKERYRGQMRWYARALEQLTGMETGGCYLVSIELDEIISL